MYQRFNSTRTSHLNAKDSHSEKIMFNTKVVHYGIYLNMRFPKVLKNQGHGTIILDKNRRRMVGIRTFAEKINITELSSVNSIMQKEKSNFFITFDCWRAV